MGQDLQAVPVVERLESGEHRPAELQDGELAAGAEYPQELGIGQGPVLHVPDAVADGQAVEGGLPEGQVLGIRIDKGDPLDAPYETHLVELAQATVERVGAAVEITAADCHVNADYVGAGYGVVGALEREAIRLLARHEGILLDPVYTGRAFGALLDLVRRRQIAPAETVLFWHTGGAPALFAYAADLAGL